MYLEMVHKMSGFTQPDKRDIHLQKETESSNPMKRKVTDVMNGDREGVKMLE